LANQKTRNQPKDQDSLENKILEENDRYLKDINIHNFRHDSYQETTKIDRISDYSRELLKTRTNDGSRYLLRSLQNYEMNSPFYEKPNFK